MLRRITLTLAPSVALFALAVILPSTPSPRAGAKVSRPAAPSTSPAPRVLARSGYIVASS